MPRPPRLFSFFRNRRCIIDVVRPRSCLIIGAGMAGLTAARVLQAAGSKVLLLDKGRSVGGRMATRRMGESRFDHGAQFFTVRDPRFSFAVQQWVQLGWATGWFTEGGHCRYRGQQSMSALAKSLALPFDIRTETCVRSIVHKQHRWQVTTSNGELFQADMLLMTPPAPQTLALLENVASELPPDLLDALKEVRFDPCFALMAILRGREGSQIPSPGYLRPDTGPIAWIADNTQKGISEGNAVITIHARPDISALFEAPREELARILLQAAQPLLASEVLQHQLHRWKYSQPVTVCTQRCLHAAFPALLAIAGDAFGGPRIEGAFLSGLAAAEALLQSK